MPWAWGKAPEPLRATNIEGLGSVRGAWVWGGEGGYMCSLIYPIGN